MPCDSSYMNPTAAEIHESNLYYVRDELNGIPMNPSKWGQGYHPEVYNRGVSKAVLDSVCREVCRRLQECDVSKLSLEAQMWWRDHQKADRDRLERELATKREADEKAAAIAKLTPYERKLLRLE